MKKQAKPRDPISQRSMEACCRLRTLFKNLVSSSSSSSPQRLCYCNFSSSSTPAARKRRVWRSFSGDDDSKSGGSSIYRHALKFQRPTTIYLQDHLRNSVSFIGTVELPLKNIYRGSGQFGVYTLLKVKTSGDSNRPFRILLKMWDEMAELSIQHLKPKDFIYVSGHIGSYTKTDMNGKLRTNYEVNVKEINYVAQHGQGPTCKESVQSNSKTGEDSVESGLDKYKNRLHLWQVYFANPYEWWDNRKSKVNPKHPDFRHKDTGEALWLSFNDPPWIKTQLQLHDSRSTEGNGGHLRSRSRVSPFVYDE